MNCTLVTEMEKRSGRMVNSKERVGLVVEGVARECETLSDTRRSGGGAGVVVDALRLVREA